MAIGHHVNWSGSIRCISNPRFRIEIQMSTLLDNYTDADFLAMLQSLMPAVGVGIVIGFVLVVIGLIVGFIVRAGTASY